VERKLTCDCGFEARAPDDERLVVEVKRHASEAHGMELSDAEARALVLRTTAGREPRREDQ
jgi:uncharacterized protein DUF1059